MAQIIWTDNIPSGGFAGIAPACIVSFKVDEDVPLNTGVATFHLKSTEPDSIEYSYAVTLPYRNGEGAFYDIKDMVLSSVKDMVYPVTTYPGIQSFKATDVDVSMSVRMGPLAGNTYITGSRTFQVKLCNRDVPTRDNTYIFCDIIGNEWFPTIIFGKYHHNKRFYAIDSAGVEYETYSADGTIFNICSSSIVEVGVKEGPNDYSRHCLPVNRNSGIAVRYYDLRKGCYSVLVGESGGKTSYNITELSTLERSPVFRSDVPPNLDIVQGEPMGCGRQTQQVQEVIFSGDAWEYDSAVEMLGSFVTEYRDGNRWVRCNISGSPVLHKNGRYEMKAKIKTGYRSTLTWL